MGEGAAGSRGGGMTLQATLIAAGMSPPLHLVPGRWMRFPGVNKGRANRSGWCRVITPTLAVYGDWSIGLSEVWRDSTHQDDERSRAALAEARRREREFAAQQAARQQQAAQKAADMIRRATVAPHPYLARKGFPSALGLVLGESLLVPVRDVTAYQRVLSLQEISPTGEKRFLPGGRTRLGVLRIGQRDAERVVLCEGYATGLSLSAALARLGRTHAVIVCFSARNLELVAPHYPGAVVAADNDASGTGEMSAKVTGLPWTMPPTVGTDFNDLHQAKGVHAVTEALRDLF